MSAALCSRDVEAQAAAMQRGCIGCQYHCGWCCGYYLFNGHRRPCPPGEKCTVKVVAHMTAKERSLAVARKMAYPSGVQKQKKSKRRVDLDRKEIIDLYDSGGTDMMIAQVAGCAWSTVRDWRKRTGRPANGHTRRSVARAKLEANAETVMSMYLDGASDAQIARKIGVGATTIWNWRELNDLPTKYRKKTEAKHEKE